MTSFASRLAEFLDFTAPDLAALEELYLERPECYPTLALNPTLSPAGARVVAGALSETGGTSASTWLALARVAQRGRDLEAALGVIDNPFYWAGLIGSARPGVRDLRRILEAHPSDRVALAALGDTLVRRRAVRAGLGPALLELVPSRERLAQWASLVREVEVESATAARWVGEFLAGTQPFGWSDSDHLALATVLDARADVVAWLETAVAPDHPAVARRLAGCRHLSVEHARVLAGRPGRYGMTPTLANLLANPFTPSVVLNELGASLRADGSSPFSYGPILHALDRRSERAPGDPSSREYASLSGEDVRQILGVLSMAEREADDWGDLLVRTGIVREWHGDPDLVARITTTTRRWQRRRHRAGKVAWIDGPGWARAWGPGVPRGADAPRTAEGIAEIDAQARRLADVDLLVRASVNETIRLGRFDPVVSVALAHYVGTDPQTHRRVLALAEEWAGKAGELRETLASLG